MAVFRKWFVCVVATTCLATSAFMATTVRPVNLEEMTERAATIFSGRCTTIEVAHDPRVGGAVTTATFTVDRVVKGVVGSTVTMRTLGVAGLPGFEPGEEVVLFLYGESELSLSSPVGLGQGKFTIFEDKRGNRLGVSAFGNENLLRGLSPNAVDRLGVRMQVSATAEGIDPGELLDMAEILHRMREES